MPKVDSYTIITFIDCLEDLDQFMHVVVWVSTGKLQEVFLVVSEVAVVASLAVAEAAAVEVLGKS